MRARIIRGGDRLPLQYGSSDHRGFPLRVLVVTSQFPIAGEPGRGRPIYQTLRELSALATVRVLSPVAIYPRWARPRSYVFRAPEHQAVAPGCDVRFVTYSALPAVSRPFNGASCARALAEPVAEFAPDVILSYWLYPDAYGAMVAARRAGVPLVAGARGSDIRVRDTISRWLTRRVVRNSDRLLCVSRDLGRLAISEYGAREDRVHVIPNGCDASIFHPGDRGEARSALGIDANAGLLVYVGRLVPEKGLRELLAAAAQLRATRPRLELAIVGDGPMREELAAARAASAFPLHLPGAASPTDVARWMVASDVVTLPSYSEGHPNVLVEALACGRPVVSTPVGGIPEVVDETCGVLVPPRDPQRLAAGLERALSSTWDSAALAARFSRDWASVAAETLEVCEASRRDYSASPIMQSRR